MQLRNIIRSTALVLAISATGCASTSSEFDNLSDTAQEHEYQQTSAQNILDTYGNPLEIQEREDGYVHFVYEVKEENVSSWTSYIPVKALLFGVDTVEDTITAVFIFDENRMLVETIVNEESVENNYGIGNRRFYPSNRDKS